MTLQEKTRELVAGFTKRCNPDGCPRPICQSIPGNMQGLADALLEEVAKRADDEADRCTSREAFAANQDPDNLAKAKNWRVANQTARILADEIRSGKGK